MIDSLDQIKPIVDAIRQGSYITAIAPSTGKLYSQLQRLHAISQYISSLHLWLSDIISNSGKYRERRGDDGVHVIRRDDGEDFKIIDDIDVVKINAEYLMNCLSE